MKKPYMMNRRHFLRSSSGLLIAMPFLPSLLSSKAMAQMEPVNRFVCIQHTSGVPYHYFPQIDFSRLTKTSETTHEIKLSDIQGDISRCFSSNFDSLRDRMMMFRSIFGMEEWGNHRNGAALTAVYSNDPVEKRPSNNTFYESIDQIIAKKIYESQPFAKELNLTMYQHYGDALSYNLDSNGDPVSLPLYKDPLAVFNDFFAGMNTDGQKVNENESQILTIDKVLENLKSVRNNRRISSQDKERLNQFAEELYETQSQLGSIGPQVACTAPEEPNVRKKDDLIKYTEVTYKLLALTLKCDLTRIVNYFHAPQNDIAPHFSGKTHHGVSHNNADMGIFADMYRFKNDFVANFVKDLDVEDPLNPDSSMLDNTLIFVTNEIGSQSNSEGTGSDTNHLRIDLPCVLFGNVNNYFKMGRYIDYRNGIRTSNKRWWHHSGHAYNQVLITIMRAYGLTPDKWERNGLVGFGDYHGARYNKPRPEEMTLGNKRDALPKVRG